MGDAMREAAREVELKAVVDDLRERRRLVEAAGARLVFAGRLEDRRYDTADRALAGVDHVLRLRTYRTADTVAAHLDWKGPTEYADGFKVRDELTTSVGDPNALAAMLDRLGYRVTREIDREILQYALGSAPGAPGESLGDPTGETMIRFERYPRMDTLVEVEGTPEGIEQAIAALALPRHAFTTERLPDFVRAYETRTGVRAALCDRELAGDFRYSVRDA